MNLLGSLAEMLLFRPLAWAPWVLVGVAAQLWLLHRAHVTFWKRVLVLLFAACFTTLISAMGFPLIGPASGLGAVVIATGIVALFTRGRAAA